MRVIVAGGRHFQDYANLVVFLDKVLINQAEVEIVSGGAKGADSLGERYAIDKNHPKKVFPADWDGLGRGAGYIRNKQMAEYADALVAFWDGESKGTKHMIDTANKMGLKVRIYRY